MTGVSMLGSHGLLEGRNMLGGTCTAMNPPYAPAIGSIDLIYLRDVIEIGGGAGRQSVKPLTKYCLSPFANLLTLVSV